MASCIKPKFVLLTITLAAFTTACGIDAPKNFGDNCEGFKSIYDINGKQCTPESCNIDSLDLEVFDFVACPVDYPLCRTDKNNDLYCMQKCGNESVGCYGECIDPKTSMKYCGANKECQQFDDCTTKSTEFAYTCSFDSAQNKGTCKVNNTCPENKTQCTTNNDHIGIVKQCNPDTGLYDITYKTCKNVSCNINKDDCGECKIGESICQPGSNGEKAKVLNCPEGIWSTYENCQSAECDDNHCKKCVEGSTICKDQADGISQEYVCGTEGYQASTPCKNVSCTDSISCGECLNGTTCVEDENGVGSLHSCVNGKMTITTCDNNVSCNKDKTACGNCTNGTEICKVKTTTTQTGEINICTHGEWAQDSACPQSETSMLFTSCTTDGACGECNNTEHLCVDEETQSYSKQCKNGKWSDPEDCEYSCSISTVSSVLTKCGTCKNNTTKCENGKLYTCNNGSFGMLNYTKCPNGCLDDTQCK